MTSLIKINIIIIFICIIISIFLFFYFFWRFYCLLNKKYKKGQIQLSEYVENKYFITSDQYKLTTLGTINKFDEYIILAVHDLFGSKENFSGLINNNILLKHKISVIVFNQRNIGDNAPFRINNIGILVNDIIDVITALKNKYKHKKIILLLEGFSGGLIKLLLKQKPLIEKIIFVNPITNKKRIRFSIISKIIVCFGFLFNLNRIIKINIDYKFLSNDENYNEIMIKQKQTYFLNQILQFNYINKKIIKQINKIKIKILILQANTDKFYNAKKITSINNTKVKIINIVTAKHFLFTNRNINYDIFTEIINLL